uniref:Uncharacterized protein n=1 Tax=Pyrodinium bahamense TaxID=73915 RepID=A0A7S0FAU5_9DINO
MADGPLDPAVFEYGTCQQSRSVQTGAEQAKDFDLETELAWQLARGHCYWSGSWLRDYAFHVQNAHPLLSCCFCHAAHPYSKAERTAVLLMTTALTVPPAAVLSVEVGKQEGLKGTLALDIFVFITMPVMFLQALLELLAVLDFYVESRSPGSGLSGQCLRGVAAGVRALKGCCFLGTLLLAALALGVCAAVLAHEGATFRGAVWPLVLSRLQSWLAWFAFDLAMPCCGFIARWRRERPQQDQ